MSCGVALVVSTSRAVLQTREQRTRCPARCALAEGARCHGGTIPSLRLLSGTLVFSVRGKVEHGGVPETMSPCRGQRVAPDDLASRGLGGSWPQRALHTAPQSWVFRSCCTGRGAVAQPLHRGRLCLYLSGGGGLACWAHLGEGLLACQACPWPEASADSTPSVPETGGSASPSSPSILSL